MVRAVDIKQELAALPVLKDRRPDSPQADTESVFATLSEFGEDGGIFAGSFQGESAWERHRNGDELVQILDGATKLTIITDSGPQVLEMRAGMLTVVPCGCWHKFEAAEQVTVMTMTPQPTDHSLADDPSVED